MKRHTYIILMSLLAFPVMAQPMLSRASHALHVGDVLTRQPVIIPSTGAAGNSVVWDMQEMSMTGEAMPISVAQGNDGIYRLFPDGTTYKYKVDDNGIWLKGYENRLTKMDYVCCPSVTPFPFTYGERHTNPVSGRGVYGDTFDLSCSGVQTVEADGMGTLVLPDGKMVSSVLRVHVLSSLNITTHSSGSGKQCLDDRMEEEWFRWYAGDCRYPIIEHRRLTFYAGDEVSGQSEECWMNVCGTSSFGTGTEDDAAPSPDTPSAGRLLSSCEATVSGNVVTVSVGLDGEADMRFVVSDDSGVVYRQRNVHWEKGNHTEQIDCSGLRRGTYVLYVHANGETISEKIALK